MTAPCSEIRVIIGLALLFTIVLLTAAPAPNYGNGTAAIMVYEAR